MRLATEQPVDRIEYLYAVIGSADAEPIEGDRMLGECVGDGAQGFELALARARVKHRLSYLDIGNCVTLFGDEVDLADPKRSYLNGISAPYELVMNDVLQLKARIFGREMGYEIA